MKCELYEMLEGNQQVVDRYTGTYLRHYAWAEDKIALLNKLKKDAEMEKKSKKLKKHRKRGENVRVL